MVVRFEEVGFLNIVGWDRQSWKKPRLIVCCSGGIVFRNLFLRQANQTPKGWYKDAPCIQQVGAVGLNASSLYFDEDVTHKTAIRLPEICE